VRLVHQVSIREYLFYKVLFDIFSLKLKIICYVEKMSTYVIPKEILIVPLCMYTTNI
jgi:hypothetical protein